MDGLSVSSITSRSIPIPRPPVGGIPTLRLEVSGTPALLLRFQALALIHRIDQLTEGIGGLTAHDEQFKAFHEAGFAAVFSGQR